MSDPVDGASDAGDAEVEITLDIDGAIGRRATRSGSETGGFTESVVETRPRWGWIVPATALAAATLIGVAIATSAGGEDIDQPAAPTTEQTAPATTAAAAQTTAPATAADTQPTAPATTTVASSPPADTALTFEPRDSTSSTTPPRRGAGTTEPPPAVVPADLPFSGALYFIRWSGPTVKVDLPSGTVTTRLGLPEGEMIPFDSGLLVLGQDNVTLVDASLETVFKVEGRYIASAPGELWASTGEPDGSTTTALVKYDSLGRELLRIPANVGFALGQFIDGVLHVSSGPKTWKISETGEVTATDRIELVLPGSSASVRVTSACDENKLRCSRTMPYNGEEVTLPAPGFPFSLLSFSSSGRYILDRGQPETRVVDLANPEAPMQLTPQFGDSLAYGADFLVQTKGPGVLITDLVVGTQWTVMVRVDENFRFDIRSSLLIVDE